MSGQREDNQSGCVNDNSNVEQYQDPYDNDFDEQSSDKKSSDIPLVTSQSSDTPPHPRCIRHFRRDCAK